MDTATDRKNGNIFLWINILTYLAAPVCYVGIVQAALCDKLGASATVANLPTTGFFVGCFAPIVFACLVPHRWDRSMVVATSWGMAILLALVAAALFFPLGNAVRIGVIVGQGFLLGLLNAVQSVYLMQCLGRGTTEAGRARALKLTFSLGPIAAVAGSLAAQFILQGKLRWLAFPRDFGVLYLIGVPCFAVMGWCGSGFELSPLADEPTPPFSSYLMESVRHYLHSRRLILLWFGYFLWYASFLALPNLSLFARHAMGREPAAFSGLMTAIQFGTKAIAGYCLGILYLKRGIRAPLVVTITALGLGTLWAWTVPGYAYLAAFGFIGAGQLGGIYFPNVLLSWSPSRTATRDLAMLSLATLAASPAPALYGFLTDHWGFSASFLVGLGAAANWPRPCPVPARRAGSTSSGHRRSIEKGVGGGRFEDRVQPGATDWNEAKPGVVFEAALDKHRPVSEVGACL